MWATIDLISLGGLATAFIFSGILLLWRRSPASDWLAVFMMAASIFVAEPLVSQYYPGAVYPVVAVCSLLLCGPCLYRFTERLEQPTVTNAPGHLHFLPAFGSLFTTLSPDAAETIGSVTTGGNVWLYFFLMAHVHTYILAALLKVFSLRPERNKFHLRMNLAFARFMVSSALLLFLYSFLCTVFRWNTTPPFATPVQAALLLILLLIAMKYPVKTENHSPVGKPTNEEVS